VAELIIERIATFLSSPPIRHRKMRSINPGVYPIIDGNEMLTDTDANTEVMTPSKLMVRGIKKNWQTSKSESLPK
jgi:hypothetical protein